MPSILPRYPCEKEGPMHLLVPAVVLFIVLSIVLYLLFGNKSGTSQQESVSQRDSWRPGTVAYER